MDKTRWFAAPDVPTTDEAGAPGLHMTFWYGLWAPAGTPRDIVAKLNAAVVDTFADPAVRHRLDRRGPRHPDPRATDAGGARRAPQGRDREVVADDQGRRHQAAIRFLQMGAAAVCQTPRARTIFLKYQLFFHPLTDKKASYIARRQMP